ncbi:MAG: prolipoprotein diacylglyceryl transferase family protein, partial [Candidatus Limnocylindria bacterium]
GKPGPRDRFSQVESVEIVPASGPLSVTTKVFGIEPGTWTVGAEPVFRKGAPAIRGYVARGHDDAAPPRVPWPWVRPQPLGAAGGKLRTAVVPFARVPGVIPGAWGLLVAVGIGVAVVVQAAILQRTHPETGWSLAVTLAALAGGLIGSQIWFAAVNRGRGLGWCIQGFVLGITLVGIGGLLAAAIPVGAYVDATAPGLFLGMAIGRPGCFLGGCCGGRLTASRWALWASDQRVGGRRIPTQLLESSLALGIGIVALVAVLQPRAAEGAVFVGSIAAYTLGRQVLRPLRAEPLRPSVQRPLTIVAAALALLGAVGWSVFA